MSQPTGPGENHDETTLGDVKQPGLWAAIGSLSDFAHHESPAGATGQTNHWKL